MDIASLPHQSPDFLNLLAHDVRWSLVTALTRGDHRVHELARLLGQPMSLVSYHLKQLRDQQLVVERRSSADGRDVYYSLDLALLRTRYFAAGAARHPALTIIEHVNQDRAGINERSPTHILFLSTHNSARSQMAEGIVRHLGGGRVASFGAGSGPSAVRPNREAGRNTARRQRWPIACLEVLVTAVLMFVIILVATDTRAVGEVAALAIGGAVTLDVLWGGPISGASMNPARSFGPALIAGAWQAQWVYWLGPILGAILGAYVYQFLRTPYPQETTTVPHTDNEAVTAAQPQSGG